MDNKFKCGWSVTVLLTMFLLMQPVAAGALIYGDTGAANGTTKTFNLTATDGHITMGDGETAYMWGYASQTNLNPVCPTGNCMQYPGPTLIVNQGDTVVVHLANSIPTLPGNTAVNASIVFPGQNVTATGGVAGLLTQEATPGGPAVTYTFAATNPGTYTYYSGTMSWLQVEMGMIGALIIRPNNIGGANCPAPPSLPFAPNNGYAFCAKNAYYDREYLFVTTEIDPAFHRLVEFGHMAQVDNTTRHATAWFINGRNFPDTQSVDFAGWLSAQPYSAIVQMHPLESILMRMVSGGRNLHPWHTHGQNHIVIARDGRLLQSSPAASFADVAVSDFTTTMVAGETADAIWGPWTGKYLNWDIFGPAGGDPTQNILPHTCNSVVVGPLTALINFLNTNQNLGLTGFDTNTGEWCPDHGKPVPVTLPDPNRLAFGAMASGSPFIGISGEIPPIDPNTGDNHSFQNPMAALAFMWHSHSERELTTNNVFIGGMATMGMVLPYSVSIP